MKLLLIRLAWLAVAFALTAPINAVGPLRRDRRESAKPAPEKKEERREEPSKAAFEVEVIKDIAYRDDRNADPDRHLLDLYLPRGVKDFPILFFVHGGSWRAGDKSEYEEVGRIFASQGIGAVVINYRLSPKVQHPAHIEDVASAFAWTHANIAHYGGRPDRIFACGHSAGGHLVALLGTDDKYLKQHGLALSDVRGVIALSGVHQIVALLPIYRNVFGKDREECSAASPLNHVGKRCPPFLLLYAEHDLPTLGRMAEEMNAELKKNKCESECVKVSHRNHLTILTDLRLESDESREAIFEFIAKHSDWKPPARPEPKDDAKRERRRDIRKKDDK